MSSGDASAASARAAESDDTDSGAWREAMASISSGAARA